MGYYGIVWVMLNKTNAPQIKVSWSKNLDTKKFWLTAVHIPTGNKINIDGLGRNKTYAKLFAWLSENRYDWYTLARTLKLDEESI